MYKLYFFLLFMINSHFLYATHVFGVKMDYQCLGNSQYIVTIYTYQECGGVGSPNSINIELSSYSCSYPNTSFTLPIAPSLSGIMATPLCPNFASQSTCNGGNLPGEDVAIYQDTISLPFACPDWKISCSPAPRSSYYTNLVNPASDVIYIEALIDNSFGACYDSPVFRNTPMLYACAGQPFTYDMGAYDLDFDTLTYTLITPMASATTSASFQTGFSINTPFSLQPGTSFELNNRSGEISFTPQGGQTQFGALALRVDKYHGGKVVASTTLEMDIQSNTFCSNASLAAQPISLAIAGFIYNDSLKTAFGCYPIDTLRYSTILYDLNTNSTDVIDSLSNNFNAFFASNWTFTNSPISGNSDSTRQNITAVFSSPNLSFGNHNYSYHTMTDAACPFQSIRKVPLKIAPHQIQASASHHLVCANSTQSIQLGLTGSLPPTNIKWKAISPAALNIPINDSTIANPTLTIPALTAGDLLTYQVTALVGACLVQDSITIRIIPNPTISTQVTNASISTSLDGAITTSVTGNLAQFNYQWDNGENTPNISNLAMGDYVLIVTDYYGCTTTDTIKVSVGSSIQNIRNNNPFGIQITPNPSKNKTITLSSQLDINQPITINIHNTLGQLVYTQTNVDLQQKKLLYLQLLDSGIYYILIQTKNETYTQKIVLD